MRHFLLIVALVILGLAGGWLYRYFITKEKTIGIQFPQLVFEKTKEAVRSLGTAGGKLVSGPLAAVSSTQSYLAQVGGEKLEELKKLPEEIREGALQISTKGIELTKSGQPPSSLTVGITIKAGQQLSFLIRAAEEPLLFEIDWKDGQKDSGGLDKNREETIAHSWKKTGDYVVTIKITGLNTSQSSSFPVRVTP